MWYMVAVIEYFLAITLWSTTLTLVAVIVFQNSIHTLYNNSPPLVFLFFSSSLAGLLYMCVLPVWMLISCGQVPSLRHHPIMLLTLDMIVQNNRFLYDVATLTLFARRLTILLFPLKRPRLLTLIHVVATVATFAVVTAATTQMYATNIIGSAATVPEGCFSALCMSQMVNNHTTAVAIRFILTSSIVVVGSAFLIALHKRHLMNKATTDAKINRMVNCVFYLRIILEVVPVIIDQILSKTVNATLSYYIGPYAAIGFATECFAGTYFYFKVLKKTTYKVEVPPQRRNRQGSETVGRSAPGNRRMLSFIR
ncbi:hypothetical protein QR680_016331 [Steinernema hermaphroditum]|uniref:Uncharacterized protein n=1 Tax=Steinernema hermaphroditum TaxID=289476 RepID=A0AA39HCV4_9BILA|nr:hypothetical protein QR680_016331 [Steinernema hermaphroditum]